MLDGLLSSFYYCDVYHGLCYCWREDVTVGDNDKELEKALMKRLGITFKLAPNEGNNIPSGPES